MAGVPEPARRGIQSVEIAAEILEALEAVGSAASLSKIAAACGMPPSKVHRYLVSLARSASSTSRAKRDGTTWAPPPAGSVRRP